MATSIVNEAVAARVWDAFQTQRVVVTGFFNSNGLKDGYGIIAALQEGFYNNNIRIYGTNVCTIGQTDTSTGAFSSVTQYAQGARGRNTQIQVPVNTSGTGLHNASNIGDYVTDLPDIAAHLS